MYFAERYIPTQPTSPSIEELVLPITRVNQHVK